MSFADMFKEHDLTKQVDAESAASALHDIVQLFGSSSTPADQGTTSMGGKQPEAPKDPTAPTESGTTGETTSSPVPLGTAVSQPYGVGNGHESSHPGIDLSVPVGSQILAANSGTITNAGEAGGYGNMVEITGDDGIITRYGHLSGMTVQQGAKIRAGQVIGQSGGLANAPGSGNSTGPHLHFEVRQGDHTIDPTPFLAGGYQVVGGVSSDHSTPTTADPKELARHALQGVIGAITGNPVEDPAATPDQPTATGSTSDGDPGAIDAFLNATKQHESGGDYKVYNQSGQSNASGAYQFLGSTWRGEGGSTANAAEATPAEQDAIARKMALRLFNQFHSWKLVAIAWYGGPGIAAQVAAGKDPGSPSGQGSYTAYGDTIVRMMQGGK